MSEPCAKCAALIEMMRERVCVRCKYARVTVAHPDDHPLAARTYCGNECSPAYDGNVSFAGDDTCAHWEKGSPEHDDEHLPKDDNRPWEARRVARRDGGPDRRKCNTEGCVCQTLTDRRSDPNA